MKGLLIGLLALGSLSVFAQSYEAEVSIDWERVERGLTTGDFSCVGTCAKLSVDWAEAWHTVSGQNFRDRKRNQASNCERFYTDHYERLNSLRNLAVAGEISSGFYQARLNDEAELMRTSESTMCDGISARKSKSFKLKALMKVLNVE